MAVLSGFWCSMVSARAGLPGVSTLSLGQVASFICRFCLSVAASTIVLADLSVRCTWHSAKMLTSEESTSISEAYFV